MREQRKVVTVLFCDLVGSTALGESTDPEALRARMRRYFEDLRAILERHGGTVEKFVGDAVMAVFGIPASHEDDALRAVRAASEMRTAIADHGLEARIGVNTGEVVVGGEGETLLTGDAVNVAARLEQAASPGEILIGTETRLLVRDAVRLEPVKPIAAKGKAEPVEAFRLIDVLFGAEALARHLDTPLVGRERERQRLWRDYEDAVADSTCRLFTLLGPAGIGKSRLVADFLERVGDTADVLRGRCLSYGEGITYWPLVEMLAPLEVDPESIVASTPEETRVAFRRLLEARAAERPQVVVVDDLQWAEPAFVDLVEHVADLSRAASIFLLCIARTELLDSRPDWGGGKLNATSLLLEPLATTDREDLIDALRAGAPLDRRIRDQIVEASDGYPLYVEEMLAMLREERGGDIAVPPTIQALLQARIDALDSDLRVVLERGAIEGEVFHRGAVAELVSEDVRGDLETHLASLIRKELIWPERALARDEGAYRFRHILLRDTAYGGLPKRLRAELHERFAAWLEHSTDESAFERDEIMGYHLEQAHQLRTELDPADRELAARAAERLLAAGRGALGRADLSAAVGLLGRAIGLLDDDDPVRLDALVDLARALIRGGELEQAWLLLIAAIAGAQHVGDERVEARARLTKGSLRNRIDPDTSVDDELARALEIASALEASGDLSTLAHACIEIGMCRFQLGRAREGEIDMQHAAQLARSAGDTAMERSALTARLRPIAWGPTPASEGIAYCTSLVESEVTNVADKAQALQVRALFHAMRAEVDVSRASSSNAWALIEEFGLTLSKGLFAIDVGFAEMLVGDLERAESELRRGHDLLAQIGDVGVRSSVDGVLADVLYLRGFDDEALDLADGVREISTVDDLDAQPRWRAVRARVLSRRGAHDEAEQLARAALALLEPTDFIDLEGYVRDVLGEVLARVGRIQEAVDEVARAAALHEQKGNVVSAGRSRAVLEKLRAAGPS